MKTDPRIASPSDVDRDRGVAGGAGRACIRDGARGRFYTVVDLINRLENEARANRQGRLAEYLTRMDLVVLDGLGYLPFVQTGGRLTHHCEIIETGNESCRFKHRA
jgi:DNA replication protein DnaC